MSPKLTLDQLKALTKSTRTIHKKMVEITSRLGKHFFFNTLVGKSYRTRILQYAAEGKSMQDDRQNNTISVDDFHKKTLRLQRECLIIIKDLEPYVNKEIDDSIKYALGKKNFNLTLL